MRAAALLLALAAPLWASDKEAARREALYARAKEPVGREDVSGWLFGDYYRWDPALPGWTREHALLAGGRFAGAFKLVLLSWPMKKGGTRLPDARRLSALRAGLPAAAAKAAPPSFGPEEITFAMPGLRLTLRSLGDDLLLKAAPEDGSPAGIAILGERMEPPKP